MQKLDIHQSQAKIDELRGNIESYFKYDLKWNTVHRYLLLTISPYKDFFARVTVERFCWKDEEFLYSKKQQGVRKHVYSNAFSADCEIYFVDRSNSSIIDDIKHTFDIVCECHFDLDYDNSSVNIEFLDQRRALLSEYNEIIFDFYKAEGLSDDSLTIGQDSISDRFQQVLFKTKLNTDLTPLYAWLEMQYCLQRFRFCIGNLNLHHPYLDNPIWHGHYFQNGYVYPSYHTLYDERYFTYCEFAYQALYNFWDRIGDTLAETVHVGLKPRDVDFARVIDAISKDSNLNVNSHFLWLKHFKENDYSDMNNDRRKTVHYETVSSKMFHSHIQAFTDCKEVEKRQEWIDGRVGYFLNHFRHCIEGLQQLILFLETK